MKVSVAKYIIVLAATVLSVSSLTSAAAFAAMTASTSSSESAAAIHSAASDSDAAALKKLTARLSDSLIEFDFSYNATKANTPEVKGKGRMEMQDNDYVMTYGSMEIRRHGDEKWTIDHDSKDLVAETCEGTVMDDLTANPSVVLTSFDSIFDLVSASASTFNGAGAAAYKLSPKASGTGISSLKLYVSKDGASVLGMEMSMSDGMVITFTLSNFKTGAKIPSDHFATAPANFDNSWIFTDLR